jgi:hypothetical protein
MNNTSEVTISKIDRHKFYFETPLYHSINTSDISENLFEDEVDAYSAKNHSETTYRIVKEHVDTVSIISKETKHYISVGYFLITLSCKRKNNEELRYFVYIDEEVVIKVGQSPSLADIQFAEIGKKYDKVLGKNDLLNLKKAIGLAAHGAGAGSFVYLRRIFENLIRDTFNENIASLEITEPDFYTMRMEDKIELLKNYLPSQLVEIKYVYQIFGKGVHELDEETCLKYFSPLQLSIQLILDQKIIDNRKKSDDERVKIELQKIKQQISENNL